MVGVVVSSSAWMRSSSFFERDGMKLLKLIRAWDAMLSKPLYDAIEESE
jgi:hypothetical protein